MKPTAIFLIAFYLINISGFSQNGISNKVIILDSRYSFNDKDRTIERDYAFEVLQKVQQNLIKNGYKALLTTDNLKTMSLEERIQFTREQKSNIYVSLSFYNFDRTRYGRKSKDVMENYTIYPVVGNVGDSLYFTKARELATRLKTGINENGTAATKIFSHSFVYDIPGYGLHLSLKYKPNTAYYQKISTEEYQLALADKIVAAILMENL